jgi:hypothetical protein
MGVFTYSGFDIEDVSLALSIAAAAGVFTYTGQPVRYTLTGDSFPGDGRVGPRVVAFFG